MNFSANQTQHQPGQEAMQPMEEITLPIAGRISQNLHPEPSQRTPRPSRSTRSNTPSTPTLEPEYKSAAQEFHEKHSEAARRGHPPPEVTPRPLKPTPPERSTDISHDEFGKEKTHASQFANAYAQQYQPPGEEDC